MVNKNLIFIQIITTAKYPNRQHFNIELKRHKKQNDHNKIKTAVALKKNQKSGIRNKKRKRNQR
jgi:hypothetical protein